MTAHAYLNTRISLLAGRLLPAQAWEDLLGQPVAANHALLERHDLADMVDESSESAAKTPEQRMVTLLLRDILILARALAGRERDFILYWLHRFELANIKAIIRGKMAGRPAADIRAGLMEMGSLARLPLEDMLHTEDVAELLRALETTPYSDIARAARQTYQEQHNQFALDATFDHRYYAGLASRAHALENDAAQRFRSLMAAQIDRINLVWLLRYRFTYQLGPAQVYYLLIPSRYRLSSARLRALAQLPAPDAVLRALPPPYAALVADAATFSEVRQSLTRYALALASKIVRRFEEPLARTFAYLLLREQDLRRLRAIVRGQSLGLPTALIREAMGFDAATAAPERKAA